MCWPATLLFLRQRKALQEEWRVGVGGQEKTKQKTGREPHAGSAGAYVCFAEEVFASEM